ncbi:MAG: UTP--glucose-1-phosphate uridylyltransferase, partial [Planctomycetota bacterium]
MSDELQQRFVAVKQHLQSFGQQQLIAFWDDLSVQEQSSLLDQIESIDFQEIADLVDGNDNKQDYAALAAAAVSPPAVTANGTGAAWSVDDAVALGEQVLRDGKVAVVIVAGGQGTRLGFDKPKGMFPIGPVSNRTLFQIFADRLRAMESVYGAAIPLY